jgi:hypothetical protein
MTFAKLRGDSGERTAAFVTRAALPFTRPVRIYQRAVITGVEHMPGAKEGEATGSVR